MADDAHSEEIPHLSPEQLAAFRQTLMTQVADLAALGRRLRKMSQTHDGTVLGEMLAINAVTAELFANIAWYVVLSAPPPKP